MLKGNKGEWSEVYALFKLLGEGKLYPGDKNINQIKNLFFPIIKIIKNESGVDYEYELNGNLVIVSENSNQFHIPIQDFQTNAVKLLNLIKSQNGTFGDSSIEHFMLTFNSRKLKAKSSIKSDIRIVIHDTRINSTADLGFSIKSELGGSSTLLNAGETTNFIYQIQGHAFTTDEINQINSIATKSKIRDRVLKVLSYGTTVKYYKAYNEVFENNLILVDSLLPNIIGEVVYYYYNSPKTSVKDLTELVHKVNPLQYNNKFSHTFYEYKVKRFLTDVALGMMPSSIWKGKYDSTGGHLIVKKNGDILCYHVYDRNQFEDYLFNNTRLDTASSTRHKFGVLYEQNGEYFMKLNLQVRF